jgi:hypothetical protein
MSRPVRRLLLGPLLALCASAAVLAVDAGMANAATTASGKVRGTVKMRTAPALSAPPAGTLRNRTKVTIECRMTGQYVRGPVRGTNQWDRLTNGRYIPHAYVQTGAAIAPCPAPVAAPVSTTSTAAFIAAAVAPARQSQREFAVPASVTIAQAILESGWGRSNLAFVDRNYFGMKCFGNPGPIAIGCHTYRTTECDAARCFPIDDTFRVYASATDSFRDHGRLLATSARYRPAFAYTRNPDQFVAEVHKGGYATDPLYTVKLTKLMAQYNLYAYDLK